MADLSTSSTIFRTLGHAEQRRQDEHKSQADDLDRAMEGFFANVDDLAKKLASKPIPNYALDRGSYRLSDEDITFREVKLTNHGRVEVLRLEWSPIAQSPSGWPIVVTGLADSQMRDALDRGVARVLGDRYSSNSSILFSMETREAGVNLLLDFMRRFYLEDSTR